MPMNSKRIGLITNSVNLAEFRRNKLTDLSPTEILDATGGNTGNVCFIQATEKLLGYQHCQIDWTDDPSLVRSTVDHIVVCAANQLGAHSDLSYWAERLVAFNLPVTIMCIGAQAETKHVSPILNKGTIDFLQIVVRLNYSSDVNISVRGDYTHRLLAQYGIHSAVIGCPSLFISEDPMLASDFATRKINEAKAQIAVAAGNPFDQRSQLLEPRLIDLLKICSGGYILQHPREFLDFCSGRLDSLSGAEVSQMSRFMGFDKTPYEQIARPFLRNHSQVYIDIENWMADISKAGLVVGTRYHGVAVGIQASVPGCVYTIDSRTEELCEATGIKHMTVEQAASFGIDDLLEASSWGNKDVQTFQDNRRIKSIQMAEFLKSNKLEVPKYLSTLH